MVSGTLHFAEMFALENSEAFACWLHMVGKPCNREDEPLFDEELDRRMEKSIHNDERSCIWEVAAHHKLEIVMRKQMGG